MYLRIRDLREDNDLYQRHIAEYLGCKQQTYSRYETGELEPSLPVMAKLAKFYKTSVDFLMGLTDVREPYIPAEPDRYTEEYDREHEKKNCKG
ncbi:MAG: helix-turn-helix domain-containing protein [Eubacterium sp.]|nr:helix-turn-helix domain-containing protein [Eubacterium sp.]